MQIAADRLTKTNNLLIFEDSLRSVASQLKPRLLKF
jgi:hypothetical protein